MKRKFGEIIGERQLSRIGSQGKVTTIALGKPRRKKDGDWECPFLITGSKIQYGYGVDALQALTTAIEGIRVMLEQSGKTFSLLGENLVIPDSIAPFPHLWEQSSTCD